MIQLLKIVKYRDEIDQNSLRRIIKLRKQTYINSENLFNTLKHENRALNFFSRWLIIDGFGPAITICRIVDIRAVIYCELRTR